MTQEHYGTIPTQSLYISAVNKDGTLTNITMTQEQNTTCDCTHTQACEVCAASKDIDWNIIKPKEQNTVKELFVKRFTEESIKRGDKPPYVDDHDDVYKNVETFCISLIEEYHASKLKELSEKGEPSESDMNISGLCNEFLPNIFDLSDFKPKEIAWFKSAWQQGAQVMFHKLKQEHFTPVIAALRAENFDWRKSNLELHKEVASLRAQLETAKKDAIDEYHAQFKPQSTEGGKAHE